MNLVHERKKKPGTWEVAWTWLPQFLGADPALVKEVDRVLTDKLNRMAPSGVAPPSDVDQMTFFHALNAAAIDAILVKYPIKGLGSYLWALTVVEPEVPEVKQP